MNHAWMNEMNAFINDNWPLMSKMNAFMREMSA